MTTTPGLSVRPYNLRCTLTFGDIYGQILIWMAVIFVSLAAGLALMGASKPIFALNETGNFVSNFDRVFYTFLGPGP